MAFWWPFGGRPVACCLNGAPMLLQCCFTATRKLNLLIPNDFAVKSTAAARPGCPTTPGV
eukprot:1115521-Lingulodinium_polyedra.AAC.1